MVTSSTAITVSWQTPSVTNGIISYYTLYYYVDAMEYSVNVAYNGQMVRIHKYIVTLAVTMTRMLCRASLRRFITFNLTRMSLLMSQPQLVEERAQALIR